jgi:transcriptional regulator with PAS, ATPase and Fis domain
MQRLDRLIELPDIRLFSSRLPITNDGKVSGAIVILQDASKIEKLEHTYRKYQSRGLVAKYTFKDILGTSASLRAAIDQAKAFAAVDSPILIEGETGTGKELFAQSIHNASYRKSGPFVAINCAALPESLLESELMGYEEGAFTGARRGGKAGLFELAHGGTIFLDEISQVPIQLQGAILRVLQEKQVLRVGGTGIIPIDVRVIAASNENLRELVREGRMRQDLYYRLNILKVHVPPLRERTDDIPLLLDVYYQDFLSAYPNAKRFSQDSIEVLRRYRWPGNIRELVNFVERYMISQSVLGTDEKRILHDYFRDESEEMLLSPESGSEPAPPARAPAEPAAKEPDDDAVPVCPDTLGKMEGQIVRMVLEKAGGNRQKAAAILAVSRPTLLKKLDEAKGTPVSKGIEPVWVRVAPLESMTRQMIEVILAQNLGSRKKTAEFLGISRSTLWKHLQEER